MKVIKALGSTRALNWACIVAVVSTFVGATALSPSSASSQSKTISSRRAALTQLVSAVSYSSPLMLLSSFPATSWASLANPQIGAITTVNLDSSEDRIGVELVDVSIGTRIYPAVKAVQPQGAASNSGVVPGMVLLGIQGGSSKFVVDRIKSGPYPIVLQFYNLAKDDDIGGGNTLNAEEALAKAQERGRRTDTGPPVSSKGTGLVVKTVAKGDCLVKAKRGDTLIVNYEGRVASPGGPIFDQGSQGRLVLGSKQVVDGVEIGLAGMCPGEVRTLDIPSSLGFGPRGSEQYDVPGDVRLWWKVELVDLIKKT